MEKGGGRCKCVVRLGGLVKAERPLVGMTNGQQAEVAVERWRVEQMDRKGRRGYCVLGLKQRERRSRGKL